MSPLLAQSGHPEMSAICPLSGVKRTSAAIANPIMIYEYAPYSGGHAEYRAPEEDHERRRVSRRSQAGAQRVPRSGTRPARRDPRDQGLGHVRQRPAHLPRPAQSGWRRHGWHQAGGRRDRRSRALRRGRGSGHRRHRQGSPDRPTRDGPPLRRLQQLQALPRGLDADVPRGTGGLRLRRPRRPREVHEGAGVDAAAAARLALLRHRGRHLLRRGQVTLEVSPDLLRRQVTLVGSWTFSKQGQAECAEFIADRKVDVERLFAHRWRLEQAEEAYRLFDTQTTGKAVILPS